MQTALVDHSAPHGRHHESTLMMVCVPETPSVSPICSRNRSLNYLDVSAGQRPRVLS